MEAYKTGFYAQNCPPTQFSWFDDWEYPAYTSHVISLFLLPLNFYGGYCILFKTSKKMEGAKWIMFNLHFWTSFLDILMSSMLTPYLFFPALCGFTVGIFSWLGVHPLVEVFFCSSALGALGASLVVIFENRHNVVATDRWVITGDKARVAFYAINYGYGCVFLLPTYFFVPDQESAKLEFLKIVPCPTPYYFEPRMFVLMNESNRLFIQVQCTAFFWILVAEGAFFVSRTVYFLTAKNQKLSEKTREMQKKFFKSICIQVAIPVFIVVLPIAYCGFAIEFYWYNQALTNTATICISLHGMSSTIAILVIYEPYRTFTKSLIKRLLWWKRSQRSVDTVAVTPTTSKVITRRSSMFHVQV